MEIKFKAWDGVKMYPFTLSEIDAGSIRTDNSPLENHTSPGFVAIDKLTILQFTGFTDRNGIEIYAGDILDNSGGNYKGVVEFKNGGFTHRDSPLGYFVEDGVVEDNRSDYDDNVTLQESDVSAWAVVIGNKFQNPELL